MSKRDYLGFADCSADETRALLTRAIELKRMRGGGEHQKTLAGRTLALIFEKASTRTRASFEVAMLELGGHAMTLEASLTQVGRGEPPKDTARVLSRYCHAIALRTLKHETAVEFARYATVPVVNALTDQEHPCQVLADLMTILEQKGRLEGLRYAWIGDGNNVANSWVRAASLLGLTLTLACPEGFEPAATEKVRVVHDPREAAVNADVLITDVWASMGQESEREARQRAFAGYTIDASLLASAAPKASVLHCLPAHRGEEIADDVLEGPQSVVFDEAENRLHAQKALLERLLA